MTPEVRAYLEQEKQKFLVRSTAATQLHHIIVDCLSDIRAFTNDYRLSFQVFHLTFENVRSNIIVVRSYCPDIAVVFYVENHKTILVASLDPDDFLLIDPSNIESYLVDSEKIEYCTYRGLIEGVGFGLPLAITQILYTKLGFQPNPPRLRVR